MSSAYHIQKDTASGLALEKDKNGKAIFDVFFLRFTKDFPQIEESENSHNILFTGDPSSLLKF